MDTKQIVNRLFVKLHGRFATKPPFSQGIEVVNIVKAAWREEIERKGVTPQQLQRGVERIVDDGLEFFPDIGKFLSLCQPSIQSAGLPDPNDVYRQATQWLYAYRDNVSRPHPAILKTIDVFGRERVIKGRPETTEQAFRQCYIKICKDLLEDPSGLAKLEAPKSAKVISIKRKSKAEEMYGKELEAIEKHRQERLRD